MKNPKDYKIIECINDAGTIYDRRIVPSNTEIVRDDPSPAMIRNLQGQLAKMSEDLAKSEENAKRNRIKDRWIGAVLGVAGSLLATFLWWLMMPK